MNPFLIALFTIMPAMADDVAEPVTVHVGATVNNAAMCSFDTRFCLIGDQVTDEYTVEGE